MRTCQCGGIIRQQGVPYFDVLPSCSCASPIAIQTQTVYTSTTTTLTNKEI